MPSAPDSVTHAARRLPGMAIGGLLAIAMPVAGADGGSLLDAQTPPEPGLLLLAALLIAALLIVALLAIRLLGRTRALRQSRLALRTALAERDPVLAALPDLIVLKDVSGTYLSCNDAFAELLHRDPADLVGRRDAELFAAGVARRWRSAERAAVQAGHAIEQQEWLRLPERGFTALMLFSRSPLYDDADRLVGVLSVARDVTARHRAEEQLRQRESFERALLDNFPFQVWLKDRQGRFQAVNRPFAEAAGVDDPLTLVGKTDLDIRPREQAEAHRAEDRQIMASRRGKSVEERVAGQGHVQWFETYKAPIVGDDGEVLGTVGFARDVSQRHQTEQALRLSERRFRAFFEKHSAILLFIEPDSGVIVDANEAAVSFYGYPRERLIRMSVNEINTLGEARSRAARHKVVSGEQTHFEFRHRLASGEVRVVDVFSVAVHTEGRDLLLSIVHDITERTQAVRELELERNLFSTGPVVVLAWSLEQAWTPTAATSNCAELLGYTPDRLVAGDVRVVDLMHPDDRERVFREDGACMSDGTHQFEQSYRLRRKDGDYIWVHDFTRIERRPDGTIESVRSYLFDESQTKQLELSLADERQRLQYVIEGTGAGTWEWNVQSGETRFNDRWTEIIGYRLSDLLPVSIETWTAHTHPDDLAKSEAALKRHFVGETDAYACEVRTRHRDGHWVWVLDRGRVFEWTAAGEPLWMYGTRLDITERKIAEQRLHESEDRLRRAGQNRYDLLYEWHVDSGALQWFSDVDGQLGYPPGQLRDDSDAWLALIHPADRQGVDEIIDRRRHSAEPIDRQYRVRHADGGYRRWQDTARPVLDARGQPVKWIGVCSDITEYHEAQEHQRLAETVFQHAHEGIVVTDPQARIVDVNDAFTRITGYSRKEALGRDPSFLGSGHQDEAFYARLWDSLRREGFWRGEIWNRRKDGRVYVELLAINAILDEAGRIQRYVGMFSDITQLKEQQSALERIAYYDALTDLPNRVMLGDRLRQAMRRAERHRATLAVVYLDLDGFKAVNDSLGHDVGDRVLVQIAGRLLDTLRGEDTLARLGGDEFVAILADLDDVNDCLTPLPRLLDAASRPLDVGDRHVSVTASLGVTLYPQAERLDPDQLLRQADHAMYQAKLAGKNRYHFFDTEQDQSIRGRAERIDAVRAALDHGEFLLYYQPKVNMRSGRVVGVEALIRWPQADGSLLPPDAFIPLIEHTPLAAELDAWVMDQALAQLERWRADGLSLSIAVNVSAYHLQQPDFIDRLRDHLAAHPAVAPGDLIVEVLETKALMDLARMSEVIRTAQAMGVGFALDDFGTGFSSLDYLRSLPARQLKIDRSFVRDMLDDRDDLAILEGIVGLANAFSRELVAEGVESVEHGEFLLRLGCEVAQGYGIGRPMPAERLPAWIAAWRPEPAWTDKPPITRDDLPLMFAMVEHRAWTNALRSQLNGQALAMPEMSEEHCRFGQWLAGPGTKRYGKRPDFDRVRRLHHEIHELAAQVLVDKSAGDPARAGAALEKVCGLRDRLADTLKALLNDHPRHG